MTTENNAGLSEEELAALEDEDTETSTDDDAEPESDTETGDVDAATDDGEGDNTDEEEETDSEETAADEEAVTAKAPAQSDFQPKMAVSALPEDLTEQVEANNTAIAELDKKLEDGEIDYTDHIKANRELLDKRSDLQAQQRESAFVSAQNEAQATQQWNWEQSRFIEDNAEFKSPVLHGALSGVLSTLYADDANADKSYRWFLNEAGRQVKEAFGRPVESDAGENNAEESAAKAAVAKAKKGKKPGPKTLGAVPEAAATTDNNADPFAAIDDLPGMEQEAALAKMSKADQDKYLNTRVG